MREYDLSNARWRKSSFSGGSGGEDCIEVADGVPGIVPVRDSKVPDGPVLMFAAGAWAAFVGASVAHPSGPWRDGSGAC
ncbi:DUF397 domain-containing protein [Streptomyces montanus]|uniref:DUF397 domain-containing protein n=1 Tax=Streptomyces montanus TaxID=2580423 RepID=A0A5R9FE88_9ACTN|nr:DUF397 domain-containing protein [Streptomyces montanus]TLS40496.1 DUF397 domain-containing protein [Streptomyces montanus]